MSKWVSITENTTVVIEGKPITADFSNGTGISIDKKNIYCYKLMDPSIILIPLGKDGTVADVVTLRKGNEYDMERLFRWFKSKASPN